MTGVLYAAIGAAFLLGVFFVLAYARRGSGPTRRHGASDRSATGLDAGARGAAASPETDADIVTDLARPGPVATLSTVEADALRRAAEAEAAATRRAAAVESDAVRTRAEAMRTQADELLAEARAEAGAHLAEARRAGAAEVEKLTRDLERQQSAHDIRLSRLDDLEARLDGQESRLDQRAQALQKHAGELAARKAELDAREHELQQERDRLAEAGRAQERELERVAGLSVEEARVELLAGVEAATRRDAAVLVRSIESEARAEGTERARAIVVEAVQRVASSQTTESVVSVLHLPGDEMKGRIIGREGRNIRAFESVTGVNVLIDDTPEAVLLSCFDPVRREVARLTLDKLVQDGRIHPQRIEEVYELSRAEVEQLCLRAARDAVAEVGIAAVDDRLMPYLGRLKYRTSYGQNVLAHLVETAHIAGVMAAELGIEPTAVKRAAFLHDIGKALTHEVEGSHAIVGAELLRKYGEDELIAHAVEAHHNEVQPKTIEAVLTQASDTCSAARPGARRESLENYVKRLARIEEIASSREGVEKVFAMQAGREVRVMVQPGAVDDLAASVLAREIAKQIEDELTYPGQIRVTVVRESRATEIAH